MTTVATMRGRRASMVADLEALVSCESPSRDAPALAACATTLEAMADRGVTRLPGGPDGACLLVGAATPRVLWLGHYDTVWPVGTIAEMPWTLRDGRAWGPGSFDMKAGIVQGLHALATLPTDASVGLLLTPDEEVGSGGSRPTIERLARAAEAVLVLEPAARGALKTARSGVATYEVDVSGVASHAGLEPERGANAACALAEITLAAARLADDLPGATMTPTLAAAGTAINVVPAGAVLTLDSRTRTLAQQAALLERLRDLAPATPGTGASVRAVHVRPPLEARHSEALFARACATATDLGLDVPEGTAVGGASDGNLTAALGVPTLDGLGAVGDGAHATHEHVEVDRMPERAALLAALTLDLLERRP